MERPIQPPDISAYLARPNEVELELVRLFRSAGPRVIFDVGSCEGEDSVRYSRRFPGAKIFAFEPLPANQDLVRANFARYAVANAEVVPLALSDRAGTAEFHVSSGRPREEFAGPDWNYGNKSSSLLAPATDKPMFGWLEFKETITVPTDTLDHFCAQRKLEAVDFVHLDVQGAEHLVLAGATTMLSRALALWLEVSDQALYRGQILRSDIENLLRSHGFQRVFEVRREIEGDQFYVNTAAPAGRRYLRRRRTAELIGRGRALAGKLRRAVFGGPKAP